MNSILPAENAVISSRTFAARRDDVFTAFANPEVLERWWGPEGFSNTIGRFEFVPGGIWEVTMRSPDGAAYPNTSQFVDIVPDSRIVYDHLGPVHRFRMTMTYEDELPGCLLAWRMDFETSGEAEQLGEFLLAANQQNFDRLAAALTNPNLS